MHAMNGIRIQQVDIHHPILLPTERVGLALAKDKYERYISKGWIKEAHGCASAILIMYQAMLGERNVDTGWGEL
jgi:hypothetical protein